MDSTQEPLLPRRRIPRARNYIGVIIVLLLVCMALAFVITNTIDTEDGLVTFSDTELEVLLCLYMAIPVIALAIYFKKAEEPVLLRREDTDDDAFDSNEYLLGSVYIFGSGTMFLRIQQLFSYSYCLSSSSSLVYAIFSFIFTALQMCFLHVFLAQRLAYHWVMTMSLYFLIGANISTYITYIPEAMAFNTDDKQGECGKQIIPKQVEYLRPYLLPLVSEFSLVSCSVIAVIINKLYLPEIPTTDTPQGISRSRTTDTSLMSPVDGSYSNRTSTSTTSLRHNESDRIATSPFIEGERSENDNDHEDVVPNRERITNVPNPLGCIVGIICALLIIVSSLCCQQRNLLGKDQKINILSFHYSFMIVVSVLQLISCFELAQYVVQSTRISIKSLRATDVLLLISVSAIVVWEMLVMISSAANFKVAEGRVTSILSFACRTFEITASVLQAWLLIQYQHVSEKIHLQRLKQYLIFLTITNIRLWIVDSFIEIKSSGTDPMAQDYYNNDIWKYIQSFCYLWAILFRFQSGVISFQIIKTKFAKENS